MEAELEKKALENTENLFNVAILWPLSTFTPRRHLDSLAISILWPLSVFTSREDFEKKVLENTETSRYYQERA